MACSIGAGRVADAAGGAHPILAWPVAARRPQALRVLARAQQPAIAIALADTETPIQTAYRCALGCKARCAPCQAPGAAPLAWCTATASSRREPAPTWRRGCWSWAMTRSVRRITTRTVRRAPVATAAARRAPAAARIRRSWCLAAGCASLTRAAGRRTRARRMRRCCATHCS
jgi:hypothetical protein